MRYENRARPHVAEALNPILHPVDVLLGLQQPVDGDEGVVYHMADQVAAARPLENLAGGRLLKFSERQTLKWSIEVLQQSIHLHAHLVRERPSCRIIRR